jgi:replicative DNA helicase
MLHPDMQSFEDNFNRGLEGKNLGIPMGFRRLSRIVGLRRATYYLLGGYTGSAKTTLLDDAFILNPSEWFLEEQREVDLKIIYFSMERRKDEKIARWISRSIFKRDGIIVPMNDILSWQAIADNRIAQLVERHKGHINDILENVVDIYDGPINPTGVYMKVREFAEQRGEFGTILVKDKNKKEISKRIYIPHNPNEVILIVIDHIGLCKGETEKETKTYLRGKPLIDKMSEYLREIRDLYGYSPVVVSQFNRSISNPIRLKSGDAEPMLEDFKDTGDTQEDAQVVISLFDPIRYGQEDPSGYNLDRLRDEDGNKKYRSINVLKNSYGPEDVRIGMALQPQVGLFKEMPRRRDITEEHYQNILDNVYFLTEN